ncbi:MAG: DUF58 domain-containing protein [Acidobacteria bacterium]|nr:DUF58 domain-containing protein [Acidobacteriota bacterium]MYH22378.1 DUF58 domain-containing protein [Acidobacteriota bacterium]MYK80454.1 DUF58 domain-containing protein [Acidobacteriota bacterium]
MFSPGGPSGEPESPAGVSTAELLARVRHIEIRTRKLVTEALAGAYLSTFKGQGMEFSEVREYAAGDDIRAVDWNVTSRTGDLHVKKFVEEREQTVLFLLDVSRSFAFGSRRDFKRATAAEASAALAFSAIRSGDRVGALLFTDRPEIRLPARKGRRHGLRVLRDLLYFEPEGAGTDLAEALGVLNRAVRRRATVFLVSDFAGDPPERWVRPLRVAARRHDLIAVRVTDVREHAVPDVGLIELEDAESGVPVRLDTSDRRVRDAFRARALKAHAAASRALRETGVDVVEVTAGEPYDAPLRKFFRMREKRRR